MNEPIERGVGGGTWIHSEEEIEGRILGEDLPFGAGDGSTGDGPVGLLARRRRL